MLNTWPKSIVLVLADLRGPDVPKLTKALSHDGAQAIEKALEKGVHSTASQDGSEAK